MPGNQFREVRNVGFLSPDPYIPDPGNTQSFNRYGYVNNNPLTFTDPTGFDPADPLPEIIVTAGGGPENIYTDVAAAAVEVLDIFGLSSLFGGGPTLTGPEKLAVAHGISLSSPLQNAPSFQTVSNGAASFATEDANSTVPDIVVMASRSYGIAQQFYSPFAVSAIASTAGVSPDQVRDLRVTTTPSQSPNELDQINVYARISFGFNWWDLAPGWSLLTCAYYGCGPGGWGLASISALPFGAAEGAAAKGTLADVGARALTEADLGLQSGSLQTLQGTYSVTNGRHCRENPPNIITISKPTKVVVGFSREIARFRSSDRTQTST